jgi:hypothetical protein
MSLTVPDLPSWTPQSLCIFAPSLRLRVDFAVIARRLGNQRVPVNALMVARAEFSEFFRIGMTGRLGKRRHWVNAPSQAADNL